MTYATLVSDLKRSVDATNVWHEFDNYADQHKFCIEVDGSCRCAFNAPSCLSDYEAFEYAKGKVLAFKADKHGWEEVEIN